jgi:hypothetical protein
VAVLVVVTLVQQVVQVVEVLAEVVAQQAVLVQQSRFCWWRWY